MKIRHLIVAAVAAALSACSSAGNDPVLKGKAAFTGFGCVKCHTVGGEGGHYGPDLTFVGFRKSPEWINQWLSNPHAWNPHTLMPNFHLPDDVRASLVEYLSSQKGQAYEGDAAPWNASDVKNDPVARGQVIFEKAGCITCHGLKGAGGYPNNNVPGGLIPSLTNVADGYSKDELNKLLHTGRTASVADPSKPLPMLNMPQWGKVLKDDEIAAVVEYVYSLKPKSSSGGGGDTW